MGDYVLSIDGQEIKGLDNYWKILNHTLNDYVTLAVSPSPTAVTPREVRVRTIGSLLGVTADGKTVFYRQGDGVARMPLSSKKKEEIAFEFSVTVDRQAEWRQIFEESWRIMQYRFYDPNMHGVDWVAIRDRYRPLLKYVGQNDDVYDLSNEMIGELNASHTGVRGPTGLDTGMGGGVAADLHRCLAPGARLLLRP